MGEWQEGRKEDKKETQINCDLSAFRNPRI